MTKRLNLNNYLPILPPEDLKDADLIIVPHDDANGFKFPLIYYQKKPAFVKPEVVDIDGAIWTPVVCISEKGLPEEYTKRVNWWFDKATDEYKQRINDIYKNLDNLQTRLKKAKEWLLTDAAYFVNKNGRYAKRRHDINKFLRGWLNKDFNRQPRRR